MSTQPLQMPAARPTKEDLAKAKRRSEFRNDALYVAGALLVTAGVSLVHISWGLMAGGFFCMLLPLLELASGFIRGVRSKATR